MWSPIALASSSSTSYQGFEAGKSSRQAGDDVAGALIYVFPFFSLLQIPGKGFSFTGGAFPTVNERFLLAPRCL